MNERIQELILQATKITEPNDPDYRHEFFDRKLFALLIVEECVKTLEFHGFDDAVPYIQWMAKNKLGVSK